MMKYAIIVKNRQICRSCVEQYGEIVKETAMTIRIRTDDFGIEQLKKLGYDVIVLGESEVNRHQLFYDPSDDVITLDYVYNACNFPALIRRGFNDQGVVIAILGTGCNVDVLPDDIKARVKVMDYTGEGTEDYLNHGTPITYLIGKLTKFAKIYHIKVISKDSKINEENLIDAFEWAFWHANIISTSWQFAKIDPCEYYKNYNGLIKMVSLRNPPLYWVSSAGNNDDEPNAIGFPACSEYITAVGALCKDWTVCDFSSKGAFVCDGKKILKPDCSTFGKNIELIDANGETNTFSGTSFSAPIVASAVAYLCKYTPPGKWILDGHVINPRVKQQCWSRDYGYGALKLFVNAPKCGLTTPNLVVKALELGLLFTVPFLVYEGVKYGLRKVKEVVA